MRNVECIPTELWREIILYACTDGGFTGRSLALTSKFFHTQSLSARFHSLAFTSLAQIEAFLVFLQLQSEDCKPQIEHLFISFHRDPIVTAPSFSWLGSSIMSRDAKEQWHARYIAAMSALFSPSLIVPTLRTLCMIEHHDVPLPPFPCDAMLKLEEFSAVHYTDVLQPHGTKNGDKVVLHSDIMATFPSLRRLHCVSDYTCPLPAYISILAETAPSTLTHLRLSGIMSASQDYASLPGELARALRVGPLPGGAPQSSTSASALPPMGNGMSGLRHLVVHALVPPSGGPCAAPDAKWHKYQTDLWGLQWRCKEKGLDMLSFCRPWQRNARWADTLRADWMDRMRGGRGCWVMSEAEEAARELYADEAQLRPEGLSDNPEAP